MPASREAVPCPLIVQFNKGVSQCLWVTRLDPKKPYQYDSLCTDTDQKDYMAWGPPVTGHQPRSDWEKARMTIVVFDRDDEAVQASHCPCVNIHALGLRYQAGQRANEAPTP